MQRRKRLFLFYAFLLSAVGLFSQAIDTAIPQAIQPGTPQAGQQSAEQLQNQPAPIPSDLAKRLRELSSKLRSEATGWREDSEDLSKQVSELQMLLREAEAGQTFLTQSLTKLIALQQSSKIAHAQEIAAIRSDLEAEISRIEGEKARLKRQRNIWKITALITVGATLGGLIGGCLGAVISGVAGVIAGMIL
jgi:uncharacterized protein involved in exopolysaccharide biosynthesis